MCGVCAVRDGSSGQDCKVVSESKNVCPVVVGWRDVACEANVQGGGQDTELGYSRRGEKREEISSFYRKCGKEVRVYDFQPQRRKINVMS